MDSKPAEKSFLYVVISVYGIDAHRRLDLFQDLRIFSRIPQCVIGTGEYISRHHDKVRLLFIKQIRHSFCHLCMGIHTQMKIGRQRDPKPLFLFPFCPQICLIPGNDRLLCVIHAIDRHQNPRDKSKQDPHQRQPGI